MPTTRSSKRSSDIFQTLEIPKRTRKARSTSSRIPIVHPLSPEIKARPQASLLLPLPSGRLQKPNYVSRGVQTDNVVVLTPTEAATLEAKAASIISQKRDRDDDSDNDHRSKRVMLTPQPNPDRNLWMFPPTPSNAVPRTAPAKSMASSSIRRVRGPTSKTPQYRRKVLGTREPMRIPEMIAPVERDIPETERDAEQSNSKIDQSEDSTPEVTSPRPTSRAGLFGSIRGLAANSLQFISSLSPIRASTQSNARPNVKQDNPVARTNSSAHNHEEYSPTQDAPTSITDDEEEVGDEADKPATRPQPQSAVPGPYDHLHIYTDGNLPSKRLKFPPRAPSPPDQLELMKEKNPNIPEAHLRRIVERRQREREARNKQLGISTNGRPTVKAPLFGPDSHFARGTVDPTLFLEKPLCMYSDEELTSGSAKRKYNSVDETNSTDIPDDHDDTNAIGTSNKHATVEDEDSEDPFLDTPTAKRQKFMPPATPRSALKKGGDFSTSIGRSGRSVLFNTNPVSSSRNVHAHYGPAGQYRGSTFADKSPPVRRDDSTLSSLDEGDVISPSTRLNTLQNRNAPAGYDAMIQLERNLGADVPEIDFTLRDPNDPQWRPSVSNPRPGSFRVPFLDESDEEMESVDDNTVVSDSRSEGTPAQPSTPRMSHAELPGSANSLPSSINPDSILFESTELVLEKARSAAQKYKPKDSSRLSEVSQPVSRSPSPETNKSANANNNNNRATPTTQNTAPSDQVLSTPPKPYIERILDNTTVGEDGKTDHQREHQYDAWAASLDWAAPQTYEEAGTCTQEIGDLVRKNWSAEDSRRSEAFWHAEFEAIEREQLEATRHGRTLQFITGMEDAPMIMV